MIVGAVMVPHPPLAVHEIGRGEETKIQDTLDAYRKAAEFIASKKPDTIILASPHALMYRDYFNVSDGSRASGSFAHFGAGNVKISCAYDRQFTYELTNLLEEKDFPGGIEYDREPDLTDDHGAMVPLYFLQQVYTDFKVVRVGLSGLPLSRHYEMGMYLRQMSDTLHRRAVFIASGDLAHCQKEDGPYGYREQGPEYDRRIMADMGSGDFGRLLAYDPVFCSTAMECGHRSFVMMAGALDRTAVLPKVLSHENTFGVGYGVILFECGAEDPSRNFLDQYREEEKEKMQRKRDEADPWVSLAVQSVRAWVKEKRIIAVPEGLPPEMTARSAGVFVSIHEAGQLRGCIGTMRPVRGSVAEEIIYNAISACSRDPRFDPVEEDELPFLEISVDVLGDMEPVHDRSELDVKRYGVLCSYNGRSGVLLPDLEGVDTVDEQIRIACQKGGINPDRDDFTIERFEVIRHV